MATSVNTGFPLYLDGATYPMEMWRQISGGLAFTDAGSAAAVQPQGGVIPGSTANLKVTAPASGLTVNVAPGYAVVPSSVSGGGAYYFGLMSAGSLTVAANSTGSTRQDYVVANVSDVGSSSSKAQIEYLTGSVTPPSVPSNSVILAQLAVTNGASSITTGMITDKRIFTVAGGGILPIPANANAPAGGAGMLLWNTPSGALLLATPTAGVAANFQPATPQTYVSETVTLGPGTTTWPVPPGTYSARVQCWADGSGGTSGKGSYGAGGDGGGGGEYAENPDYPLTPGDVIAVAIGEGGGPSAAGGTYNAGTGTSFDGSGVVANPGIGAAGGTGSSAPIHYNGGGGGINNVSNGYGWGGGSSAGPGAPGNTGGPFQQAAYPPYGGGFGGEGGDVGGGVGANGGPAESPGGGGGGGGNGPNGGTGGEGGSGQIILTYTVPADNPAFAYQPAGTTWNSSSYGSPHTLVSVPLTADGNTDFEITYHAAGVGCDNANAYVSVVLLIDGRQVDSLNIYGYAVSNPASLPADLHFADATYYTSAALGTRPGAGTHTVSVAISPSTGSGIIASPWWLSAVPV